ncbi:MAG: extracellular solute-binding protein [Pseudomonadota bacterium]
MKKVTLNFLRFHCLDRHHCSVEYHDLISDIINRFENENPHIKIESTVLRNWYQLMYKLKKELPNENGPDIFHTNGGGELLELVSAGLVHDLSGDLNDGWRDQFITASFDPLKFDGKEYAIPLEQGFVFVWYNKSIFDQLNLNKPETFTDLLYICQTLKSKGITPFSVGNRERWPGAFFFSHLFQRIGGEEVFVSDFTKADNYELIKASFISAAEKLVQLEEAGAFHKDIDYTDYPGQRKMFIDGQAAMQLNGNRLLGYLRTEGPEIIKDLDIFPFPTVIGGRGKTSHYFGGSLATYGMSSKSKHKEEAVAFLKCLTNQLAAEDVIFKLGDIPAAKHIQYEKYPSSIHGRIASELELAKKIQVHFFKYLPPHAAAVYLNAIAKLITRDIAPEESFKILEDALLHHQMNNIM